MATPTPIDDFLDRTDQVSWALRWEAIGAGVGLAATIVGVGIVALLALAHAGAHDDIRRLLRLVMVAGLALVVGSVVEITAAADSLATGWAVALTDGSVVSAMLRFLAGLCLLLGFVDETVPVGGLPGAPDSVRADGPDAELFRWVPGPASAFGFAGIVLAAVSFAFDGHTVTEGPRLVHALVNVVHVGAAGVWGGGVIGLAVLIGGRRRSAVTTTFVRFSRVATAALAPVLVSGAVMAVFILDGPDELLDTAWGRTLLVKSALVAAVLAFGAHHHRVVARRSRSDQSGEILIRGSILAETALIVGVVVTAAVLVRSSIV